MSMLDEIERRNMFRDDVTFASGLAKTEALTFELWRYLVYVITKPGREHSTTCMGQQLDTCTGLLSIIPP